MFKLIATNSSNSCSSFFRAPWSTLSPLSKSRSPRRSPIVIYCLRALYNGFTKLITFVIHRVHWPHFTTMYIIHIHSSFISWSIVTKHLAGLLLGRGRISQELSSAWASWVGKLGHRPCSIMITHLVANKLKTLNC